MRSVVDQILSLFTKYGVHVTFATVGMIMCKDKEEVPSNYPKQLPYYINQNLSPYNRTYIADIKARDTDFNFAPGMIEKLKRTAGTLVDTNEDK